MAFVRFCFMVALLYPVAVVLSVSIGVGGCLCPNSSNVILRTAPSLAFMKTAPIYASAAYDITCSRTLLMIKIAPLVRFLSFLLLLPMFKKKPSSAFGSLFWQIRCVAVNVQYHVRCMIAYFLFLYACCSNWAVWLLYLLWLLWRVIVQIPKRWLT
jgi:hypothetical protein